MLVWALDRLSREGALAILTLVHRLRVYGVKVISYQESWTEAPGEPGELLFAIAGWVARMESQRRSERTKAGLARARAQGKRLGRLSFGFVGLCEVGYELRQIEFRHVDVIPPDVDPSCLHHILVRLSCELSARQVEEVMKA